MKLLKFGYKLQQVHFTCRCAVAQKQHKNKLRFLGQ